MHRAEWIAERVEQVMTAVEAACRRSGRLRDDVTVVAASKTVPMEDVVAALVAGIVHFGENHARELAAKAPTVDATWHFLGRLQRRTARVVAAHADVVHSAEPGGGLDVLARRTSTAGETVRCLVQVDFTGRRQGVAPEDVERFLSDATGRPGVTFVGLMTLPPQTPSADGARPYFRSLRELRDRLRDRRPDLAELSMGMSRDYTVAVEEGATMLRVGTALFGERPRPVGT